MTIEDRIRAEAVRQGVPPDLAVAIARRESNMNPGVRDGVSGEIGMFQVKPSTGADMGYSNLRDLNQNIAAGVAYLRWNRDFLGDWSSAVLGYNGGPGNVQRGTVSSYARGYLAWVQQQVPWLFAGQTPSEGALIAQTQPGRVLGPSYEGSGTEMLDPSFWSSRSADGSGSADELGQENGLGWLLGALVAGVGVILWLD